MNQKINVLIVDDHPMIIEGYKGVLGHLEDTHDHLQFSIRTATSLDSANRKIDELCDRKSIDLVLLDISMPPSKACGMTSGEDLGQRLRKLFRDVKIIVITMYSNNYRIVNILKSINPEGFLVKSEITSQRLTEAILCVLNDTPFYGRPVLNLIRKHISNNIFLDDRDRSLLYQLSLGTKTKNLPEVVNLSLAAIERRKRLLHDAFNTDGKSDKELLIAAKENGFL